MNILHIEPPISKVYAVESDNSYLKKYPELLDGVGKLNDYDPY